ncbi:Pyridoxine/pyridoxamine 5'-phosphate oxidase [Frondihabitans sp. 762G35]|uniref:pyridoxine/pyridoxamine 5'-phosphate oxidase n=1 Tax=Frondihabitans sp. 762G35 TaxID=1446794 RepID=UPI000D20D4BB|nr:pyridoxal 5'-phosphate synthase [Frondihabitans sp. 762G35]ARC57209.1 Pyridoxine/pyridoxamine 5'-phosphate oxidase [Frondihabitans sp. 762G35]
MTDDSTPGIRPLLRRAARPDQATSPSFDEDAAPADPLALAREWFERAVDGGVVQPQAMTLSTVDGESAQARTVLLKDLDDAFWFATSSLSPKGKQVAGHPAVALTFYWREQGRQIRVTGPAAPGPRDVSVADFTARHPDSRAVAIAMPQSDVIDSPQDARARLDAAKERIAADDDFAPDDWTAYRVAPTVVEFWQATTGRDQVRLRYDLEADGSWSKASLWP